ncbi:MAG: translation initiation factor IF-2 [Firmicutes bacterium]|nr:translation initiation factor IF-2 [Bacillota bacterium]
MNEKIRVYELAKEMLVDSKVVLKVLSQLSVEARNHMSTMDAETAQKVRDVLTGKLKLQKTKKERVEKPAQQPVRPPIPRPAPRPVEMDAPPRPPAQGKVIGKGPVARPYSRPPQHGGQYPAQQRPPIIRPAGPAARPAFPQGAPPQAAGPGAGVARVPPRPASALPGTPSKPAGGAVTPQRTGGFPAYPAGGQARPGVVRPPAATGPVRPAQAPQPPLPPQRPPAAPAQGAQGPAAQQQPRPARPVRPFQAGAPQRPQPREGMRPSFPGGGPGAGGQRPAGGSFVQGRPGPRPGGFQPAQRPGAPRPQPGYGGPRPGAGPRPTFGPGAGGQRRPGGPGGPVQGPQRPQQGQRGQKRRDYHGGRSGGGDRRTPGFREGLLTSRPPRMGGGAQPRPVPRGPRAVSLEGPLMVKELAMKMGITAAEVIKKLISLGVMAAINQQIDVETATIVAQEMGYEVTVKTPELSKEELLEAELDKEDAAEDLKPRPPVVTVMGHVDHGKTSLLDAIRKTKVAAGEAGGITQHIGASVVDWKDRKVVFLDTPGHEAFTAMRARGAKVTDIAVLVVAADDGPMPQTIEAMNHARAAKVPVIVAINKMDKPDARPDMVKQKLSEQGLVPEEWGGDTVYVPVSARQATGLDQLLDMILLVADVQELKANPEKRAVATVVEAQLDKGRGPVATVLVQSGSLRVGDCVVTGSAYGRVRAMTDDRGRRVKKAAPSMPVEVTGLSEVPNAGDVLQVVEDEKTAKEVATSRAARRRASELQVSSRMSLEDLANRVKEGEVQELKLIVKADVQGSSEALKQAFDKLDMKEVRISIIHSGVGGITESDVMLAAASGAIIIGFNVRPDSNARHVADEQKVDIRTYRIIYEAVEDIQAAMKGMLKPKLKETVLGRAEVRQLFRIPKIGTVAGCYVTEGKITKGSTLRVVRDGVVVHEAPVDSLKRFKDDVREVASGYECGISVERFQDVKEGDILEAFVIEEVKPA